MDYFIVALVVNALGAFGLINGSSQKEVSDKYLTLITRIHRLLVSGV